MSSCRYPIIYEQSLNTVLKNDMQNYNKMNALINRSLSTLRRAIKGFVVMSEELDEVYNGPSCQQASTSTNQRVIAHHTVLVPAPTNA